MEQGRSIILIGFMGSGKTSVGLKLSYRLRMMVEDTDKLIERREGRSVSEIFAGQGEAYFRQQESALLRELQTYPYDRIYSVGGGTPVRQENRELLKGLGLVVYLRVSPWTVYNRLKGDVTRPLLQCPDPLSRIQELMEERREAYESCADVIDADTLDMEEILERIVAKTGRGTIKETDRTDDGTSPGEAEAGKQESAGKEAWDKMQTGAGKLLVINGPNLNFLGIREKSVYGTQDYAYLCEMIQRKARETGSEIVIFQSNHEGAIIDRIQEAYFDGTEGIVINPGAFTHYSYAIRDALASIVVPKVEVHISDITKREEFRRISVTAPVCDRQIYGQGLDGYLQAITFLLETAKN